MNRRGLTRRDLLRLAGAGTAGMFVACGDNEGTREAGSSHAAAVLEPESTSVLVAAWSSVARTATLHLLDGDLLVFVASVELARESGVATFDVGGLEPAKSYQAYVSFDSGARLGPHHVRTAPRADDPRAVRIAVSADLDPNPEFDSALLDHMAALGPDVFVSLGDFPYTDNGPPAVTVPTYRERHVELRTAPKVRAWLETVSVRAIYDDHEFRNDWDAMFASVERSRYAAAMQVWDEFFPLRAASGDIRYRAWRQGANVECFLLDCRRFRSANASLDDDGKTMLGEVQRAWLVDGIKQSMAPFKLVFTSVPLDFGGGNDHWVAFQTERTRIFDALAGVPGVLFVSADQHWFAAHRHARGIREFQVGPLARGLGTPPAAASEGVLFRSSRYNFGLVDVDGETLTFSGIGADGEAFYKESLTPQMLTPAP